MRNPQHDPVGFNTSDDTASSGKPNKGKSEESERRCILTGRNDARDALLRLAISPDGDVLPDPQAKAPGRGAWIGVSGEELRAAIESGQLKGALARAFKSGKLTIPDQLPEMFEAALRRSLSDRLGLEKRSGRLILGSDKIANEARSGAIAILYHAQDASEDGCKKLDQAWRVGLEKEGSGIVGERLPLDREALSVALGRENVVHIALADRKSAERVRIPLARLQTILGAAHKADENIERSAENADLASA